ncbi:MAG: hypothetical protein FWE22_06935 [Firmicutes bacterium]|nr:hypothetical protein [Bacillota bacterium]
MKRKLLTILSATLLIAFFLIGCSPNTAIHITEVWRYDQIHGEHIEFTFEARFCSAELNLLNSNATGEEIQRWNTFLRQRGYIITDDSVWSVEKYLRVLIETSMDEEFQWVTPGADTFEREFSNVHGSGERYIWRARFSIPEDEDINAPQPIRTITGGTTTRPDSSTEQGFFWNTHTFEWEHPFNSYINDFHYASVNNDRIYGYQAGTNIIDKFTNGWTTIGLGGERTRMLPSFFEIFPIARMLNLQEINLFYHWLNNTRMVTNGTQETIGQTTVHTFSTRIADDGVQTDQLILQMRRAYTVTWNVLSIIIGLIVAFGIILTVFLVKRNKEQSGKRAEDFFPYNPNE